MRVQALAREEVFRRLLTSEAGLSASEARQRLLEYGPNEITEARRTPLFLRFLSQFTHFLAVLLWLAAGLCFVSEYLRPGEGLRSLGIAIIGVIVINAVFTFTQEYRAERAVAALKALLPFKVKVIRGGVEWELPAREVTPGDLLLLTEGDKVPADARLVEASRLMVNNAPLTGESDPKPRNAEPSQKEYLDSPNLVFAGTLVVSGKGQAVALATGMATEFGKIAHLTGAVEPGLSPLQKEIIRVTRIVAAIAVILGVAFFTLGFVIGRGFWHNFLFAIGIIIANVPEGLLPTVTLSLAMGSQRMARKKALIKNLSSVETLGSVTVICSDKTGTLTQNRMAFKRSWVFRDAGPDGEAAVLMLWKIASLCNNAVIAEGGARGDPTEAALLAGARDQGVQAAGERLLEVPFDSERKRMTTVNRLDEKTLVLTKGALETVLPLCDRMLQKSSPQPLTEGNRQVIQEAYHALVDEGLRVMAFAFKELPEGASELDQGEPAETRLETSLVLVGLIGLEDPPRPEVPEAIRTCREAGIRVIMITGDAGRTAAAVARQIGLAEKAQVIEGSELEGMADEQLRARLVEQEVIFARMTPRHKMRIVSMLKEEGERVAVTGDGVNDAPALKGADIGIAMGLIGTDVAREAADMVLLDDNFATIVNAIEEGRCMFENIKKFIIYIFAHAPPEVIPYILFSVLHIPLPLTVMQILAIDLGTETIPALALGVERPETAIMQRQPRKGGLIDISVLLRSWAFLGLISAGFVLLVYFHVLFQGGWSWGAFVPFDTLLAKQASTATFLGIVIMQIANVFACRSSTESIWRQGFFSNRLVIVGIVFELLLTACIIYHPWGQKIFGTAALPAKVWLILIPFALALLFLEEGRKLWVRKWANL